MYKAQNNCLDSHANFRSALFYDILQRIMVILTDLSPYIDGTESLSQHVSKELPPQAA